MKGIEAATWGTAIKDGETRESKAGNAFVIVNIAVSEGKQDDTGKEISTFVKVLLFGPLAGEAAKIKRGDRCYCEGTLSAGIWQHESGPRLDLSIRAFKFERTQIGKQRPRRENANVTDAQITASSFAGPAIRERLSVPDRASVPNRDRFESNDEIPFGR